MKSRLDENGDLVLVITEAEAVAVFSAQMPMAVEAFAAAASEPFVDRIEGLDGGPDFAHELDILDPDAVAAKTAAKLAEYERNGTLDLMALLGAVLSEV